MSSNRSRLPLLLAFVLCSIGTFMIVYVDQNIGGIFMMALALLILILGAPQRSKSE